MALLDLRPFVFELARPVDSSIAGPLRPDRSGELETGDGIGDGDNGEANCASTTKWPYGDTLCSFLCELEEPDVVTIGFDSYFCFSAFIAASRAR